MGGPRSSERGRCITGLPDFTGPPSGRGGGERVRGSRTSYGVLSGKGPAREPTLQGSPVSGGGEEEASETCRLPWPRRRTSFVTGKSVVAALGGSGPASFSRTGEGTVARCGRVSVPRAPES